MKYLLLIMLLLTSLSCNKSGGGAFDNLEDDGGDNSITDPLEITSYIPTANPVVLTNSTSTVFGLTVSGNIGTVTYDFIQDGATTLQSGDSAFYNLQGSSLTAGNHQIKIIANNLRSSAEKTFNVRKNSPTSIVTFSPAVTGASLNCGTGSLTFSGILNDLDGDNYLVSWELDSTQVTAATPFTTVTTITPYSELVYAPDCTQAGSHTLKLSIFDGYEITQKAWTFTVNNPPPPPGSVQITSFTPTTSPVILTNASNPTFGVTIADGAGAVTYDFILDNTTTLQTGATSFLSILGSTLTPGYHSLKIVARNATTQDSKTFNLRKNTAPSVSSYTPALSGNSINCSGGTATLSANFSDSDLDGVSVSWKIDNNSVVAGTPFTTMSSTASSTTLSYTPDCTATGFHVFELTLSDGYETFSQEWTVNVNNPPPPPGNVQILTFTPTANPIVMTGASQTTFAVSIVDGAGVVNYEFKMDNTTVLQTGTTPYLVIDGSTLAVGTHSIKVKASNSVSYDEKIFTVRRNALPTSVAYSPALTGASVNCGSIITFDTTVIDPDYDAITKSWELDGVAIAHNPPTASISSNPNYGRIDFTPSCSQTGTHTMAFKGYDGYETYTQTWNFTVVNPAQEALGTTTPSGSNVVFLSTEVSKGFTARASAGIPPYTFIWTIKRTGFPDVVKLTESGVTESTVTLAPADLAFGNQSLVVTLTDSTTANNPSLPAERTWTVYKNQKPVISSLSPSSSKKINLYTSTPLSALITDASDTFTVSISRGASTCSTPSTCGLSSVVLPTSTGTFSANFTSGTTLVGDNNFVLNVIDSNGESTTAQFNLNANYFSQDCNDLAAGEICTLAGMPGIGDEMDLSVAANLSKVRIHPTMMSIHNMGGGVNNLFITDMALHLVWYWNRRSSAVQLGPYTIPANTIKAIIGVPGFATTVSAAASFGNLTASQLGTFFLNIPTGVTNTTTGSGASQVTNLYIGESGAARVIRVVFNNATSTANVLPSNNVPNCNGSGNTLDVEVDTFSTPNRLYVACNNNSWMRTLDLSSGSAFATTSPTAMVTVTSGNGGAYSDGAIPGTALTAQPGGMTFDPVDKLLYFTETNTCRLRALNPSGNGTVNLFDSWSITAGTIKTISGGYNGSAWCGTAVGYYATPATAQHGALRGVLPYRVNGSLLGYFVSDSSYHRVVFINQTNSAITIGNRSVAAYSTGVVFGLNNQSGAANNNGALLGGKSSSLNTPFDIAIDGGILYVSDYGNSRIRTLVIDNNGSPATVATNGTVGTAVGSIPKAGYNESPTLQSQNAQFNSPQGITYDSTNNRLLISDTGNYRIRSINLSTGVVDTLIGNGSNADQVNQANPLQLNMRVPRDLEILRVAGSEFTLFADSNFGTGANNNIIRALNSYGTTENVLGTEIDPGKTNVIAGIMAATSWTGANLTAFNNQPAVTTPIYGPAGIGHDDISNSIYVSTLGDNCILKIDSSGIISVYAGLCGTSGTTSGTLSTVRFSNPWDIEMDTLYPGNFFVIDSTSSSTSILKYVNTSSTPRSILGTIVSGNSVEAISLAPGPNFSNAIAVNNDQICFANGRFTGPATTQFGTQSVVCYSRAGSGSLSLYIGNRNSPGLGTPAFRGRPQKYMEDEKSPMGYGGLDLINNPVQLAGPEGLAFDASGNLYITELRGHTIRMIKKWY